MKLTIIVDDNDFGVDGVWHKIDLSALVGVIHAVQFDTVTGYGEVEHCSDEHRNKPVNTSITSFDDYQTYYTAWEGEVAAAIALIALSSIPVTVL